MAKLKNKKYSKEFARRLNKRMEELHLTQTRLAYLTGMTQQMIHKYLRGDCIPRIDTAVKLAFGLAMPVADLIDIHVD